MRAAAISLAAFLAAVPAIAGDQFIDKDGRANFGYDVVAYHTESAALEGSADFTAEFNGATFLFASAEHRDLFIADPERYAPAYDGHCAYALTLYKKLVVDPEAFVVIDPATRRPVGESYDPQTDEGVLYINYSPGVNQQFRDGLPGVIDDADTAWDDCLETLPAARPRKSLRDIGRRKRPDFCSPASS
ncbi:MAG: YHS domain-containing (seleno)protein [Pseudomonadota bacterium]